MGIQTGARVQRLRDSVHKYAGLSARSRVLEIFKAHAYDPFDALVAIATDETVPVEVRVQVHKELATYTAPKPKPIDLLTGETADNVVYVVTGIPGSPGSDRGERVPVLRAGK